MRALCSVFVLGLSLGTIVACASSTGGDAQPANANANANANAEGMQMPAAGEYVALSDPRYGHMNGASAPAQGEAAPDFELPSSTGERFRLSEALAEGPVLLMFYRGFW